MMRSNVLRITLVMTLLTSQTVFAEPFKRIESATKIPDFTLENQHGELFTQESLLGKWTLVLVGFTTCPDVCPYTLGNLEHVLAETASKVRPDNLPEVVFLAVDPARDKDSLGAYVGHFHPDFTGVTGTVADIDSFVQGLDAFYELEDADAQGNYTVRHSADVRVVDPQGRLHATLETPMNALSASDFLLRLQVDYRRNLQ